MSDSYRDVVAWQKGMALAIEVYRITEDFPRREIFGMTAQIRKSAMSIPNNIAEGKGRKTEKDYAQFCYRARGSLLETQTQLEASRLLKFLTNEAFAKIFEQACETGRVLNGLIRGIERQISSP